MLLLETRKAVDCMVASSIMIAKQLRANPQTYTSEVFVAGQTRAFGKSNIGEA